MPTRLTDPHSEVGQVGAALNRLLGHVEHAFDARHRSEQQVRQFVADASHELRTPLTTIRGYAELSWRVTPADPQQLALAIAKVEADRMTSLVDDLLLLARLDAGRPLDLAPVDMTRLVIEAVGDARLLDQEHRWVLDLPESPVVVVGDEQRLHQVATNLLNNARRHTPAGTTVTVGLTSQQGGARLAVHDDGPGISDPSGGQGLRAVHSRGFLAHPCLRRGRTRTFARPRHRHRAWRHRLRAIAPRRHRVRDSPAMDRRRGWGMAWSPRQLTLNNSLILPSRSQQAALWPCHRPSQSR